MTIAEHLKVIKEAQEQVRNTDWSIFLALEKADW